MECQGGPYSSCHSIDNDLGMHTLAYFATYQFNFEVNFWGMSVILLPLTTLQLLASLSFKVLVINMVLGYV